MKTKSAPHSATSPLLVASTASAHGMKQRVAPGHGEREVADVARADQDAVEHEHGAAERLHERDRHEHGPELVSDGGVTREDDREQRVEHEDEQAERRADHHAPLEHAPRRGPGADGVVRTQRPADDRLPGDRDRVETQREQEPQLERDLVRGDLRVADPRGDRGRGGEGEEQRARADGEVRADRARLAQLGRGRAGPTRSSGARCGGRWRGRRARPRPAR